MVTTGLSDVRVPNGGFGPSLRGGFPERMKAESRSEDKQVLTGPGQTRSISDDGNNRVAAGGPSKPPAEQTPVGQRGPELKGPRRPGDNLAPSCGTIRRDWCAQEVDATKRV